MAEGLHAGENSRALGTGVEEFAGDATPFEGKFVAAGLVGNSQVGAGFAPLLAMGLDAAAADAVLRQKVREFMAERALHLGRGNFDELGIENHHAVGPHCHTGRGAKRGIPKNAGFQTATSGCLEELVGEILEQRIVAKARIAAGFGEIIWRGANAAHDGTTKIHEKLLVFHAARAG
jgi:hypothetical protein